MPIFITISSLCMYTYYLSIITSPGSPEHNIVKYLNHLEWLLLEFIKYKNEGKTIINNKKKDKRIESKEKK